jgi:ADP-heptose:LPS heptosyltransferase
MEIQLKKSGIETEFTKNIDLSWAVERYFSRLVKKYTNREYILLFPFCSKKHQNKKWPYFKELIQKLKQEFKNKYSNT